MPLPDKLRLVKIVISSCKCLREEDVSWGRGLGGCLSSDCRQAVKAGTRALSSLIYTS